MVSSANSTKATSLVLSVPDDANDIGRGCFGFSFLSKLEPSNTRQPARLMPSAAVVAGLSRRTCYLVDPASSHTLNSKIKPCMSQYSLEKVKPQILYEFVASSNKSDFVGSSMCLVIVWSFILSPIYSFLSLLKRKKTTYVLIILLTIFSVFFLIVITFW